MHIQPKEDVYNVAKIRQFKFLEAPLISAHCSHFAMA